MCSLFCRRVHCYWCKCGQFEICVYVGGVPIGMLWYVGIANYEKNYHRFTKQQPFLVLQKRVDLTKFVDHHEFRFDQVSKRQMSRLFSCFQTVLIGGYRVVLGCIPSGCGIAAKRCPRLFNHEQYRDHSMITWSFSRRVCTHRSSTSRWKMSIVTTRRRGLWWSSFSVVDVPRASRTAKPDPARPGPCLGREKWVHCTWRVKDWSRCTVYVLMMYDD